MLTDCSSLTTQLSSEGTIGSSAPPSSGAASLAGKDSSTGASVCCFSRCVFITSARNLLLHKPGGPQHMNTSTRKEDRIRSRQGRRGYHVATGPRRGAAPARRARSGRKPGAGRGGERAGPGLADSAAGRGEAEATAMLARARESVWVLRGLGEWKWDVSRAAREGGTARHGSERRGSARSGRGGRETGRGRAGWVYSRCRPLFPVLCRDFSQRDAHGGWNRAVCWLGGRRLPSSPASEEARCGGCGGRGRTAGLMGRCRLPGRHWFASGEFVPWRDALRSFFLLLLVRPVFLAVRLAFQRGNYCGRKLLVLLPTRQQCYCGRCRSDSVESISKKKRSSGVKWSRAQMPARSTGGTSGMTIPG
jgi:hypothetical protein